MVNSPNLDLPFVEAAQAQKHVTVNESFVRLDAVAQLVLQSLSETVPPANPKEGVVYAVPAGAQAPWDTMIGRLALRSNGGWAAITPRAGWHAWVADLGTVCLFDGTTWLSIDQATRPIGPKFEVIEFEHDVQPGGVQMTDGVIPAQASVIGITARVSDDITGTLTSWKLGADGSDNRYGSGFGLAKNAFVRGLTGSPLTYYQDTALTLTPEGGDFAAGAVRFMVHTVQLDLPNPV